MFRQSANAKGRSVILPDLIFYIQDNDVHGGVHERAAALHRFLGLSQSLRSQPLRDF